MFWRFELIGSSREPLIVAIETRIEKNQIPKPVGLQIIADIENILIPPTAREDNFAIKVFSCGHVSEHARAFESSVQVLDISY